jgi:hypothetical protein
MSSFLAPRCQHIKTGGTQCGSPALRGQPYCHYHRQSRPKTVECYEDWLTPGHSGNITLPVFEDAHSVQFVVRQVTEMILQQKIDARCAGLALYGLQIASANLKRMETEKPYPTHVVIDPDKVAETPLGMTPWSASGKGHDPEEAEGEGGEMQASPAPPPSPEEFYYAMTNEKRMAMRKDFEKRGLIDPGEFEDYLICGAPDPLLLAITRLCAERDRRKESESANTDDQDLPPGTIQACQSTSVEMGHPATTARTGVSAPHCGQRAGPHGSADSVL